MTYQFVYRHGIIDTIRVYFLQGSSGIVEHLHIISTVGGIGLPFILTSFLKLLCCIYFMTYIYYIKRLSFIIQHIILYREIDVWVKTFQNVEQIIIIQV